MVPDDEVGAVVKAGITVTAQTEFVLFALRITLVLSQFDSWSVAGACHNCRSRGGIPVVSRKGGHRSSGVSDALAGSTLCVKVFHFLDARPPHPTPHHHPPPTTTTYRDRSSRQVIQVRSSRSGHMSKTHRACILFLICVTSHIGSH